MLVSAAAAWADKVKGTMAAGARRLLSSPSLNQGIYHKKEAKQVNRSGQQAKPVRRPHFSESRHSPCQKHDRLKAGVIMGLNSKEKQEYFYTIFICIMCNIKYNIFY